MSVIHISKTSFRRIISNYFDDNERVFPWRKTSDPYKIFLSEIMLQQTQVSRVLPKYEAFLKRFPSFSLLSRAPLHEVLTLWQGLGYNRRAKMLLESAQIVTRSYNGKLPQLKEELMLLPGVGVYTAGAIRVFAFNKPEVFVETNIRTAMLHFFFKGRKNVYDREILPIIEATLDRENPRKYYFALMDYGAMLKNTIGNQNYRSAHYIRQSTFKGSDRQIRGQIIKSLTEHKRLSEDTLGEIVDVNSKRIKRQLQRLLEEQMVLKNRMFYFLP